MAVDKSATIQDLERRLAEATTEAARLAVLLEFGKQTATAQRVDSGAEAYVREAINLARKVGSPIDLTSAGVHASEFYRESGNMVRSLQYAEVVQEAAVSSGNLKSQGHYFFLVGRISEAQGDYKHARECYERCLSIWREAGFARGVPSALHQLGSLAAVQGHEAEVLERFQECLRMYEELGDVVRQVYSRQNIGWALQRLGRWEDAIECYYRTMAVAEQHNLPTVRSSALNLLGELFLERDKTAKAIDAFRMVQESAESGEAAPHMASEAMCNLGLACHRQRDFAGAEQAYRRVLDLAESSGDRHMMGAVLWRMAELALDQGQLDQCQKLAQRSATVAGEIGTPSEEAHASRVLGLLHAARGEHAEARVCFEHAMNLTHNLEESLDLARVRFHYGRYLLTQGEREPALTYLKDASRTFRKLGVVREGQEVNRLLFQQEMGANRDMALLQGISGIVSLGVEPQVLLERAVGLLLEALDFDSAAVVGRGRPLLTLGDANVKNAIALRESPELVRTPSVLSWTVRQGGRPLGRIYLQRSAPAATEHDCLVLDTVANLLSAPMLRLAELSADDAKAEPPCAGLRYNGVVGRNQRMVDVLNTVCAVASQSVPVLIHGESGTGKELVARALHDSGARSDKPFVTVNCAAVPENLLEAELFGIERETAPGVAAHRGKFEVADGGTIFLDEIGDTSPSLQSKLLRVLQERTFERVGGHVPISVDVRVVAATSQPVAELIAQKKLQEDLYHRLNAVELVLPSLNERTEDIPELVRHFIRSSNQEFGRNVTSVSPEAMSQLTKQRWPGNIRELQHVVERLALLAHGDTIQLSDLPPGLQSQADKD